MLKKLLLILITALFTCSALEIEIGGVEQTFCDEYDTYIPSKPTAVKKTQTDNSKVKKIEFKKSDLKDFGLHLAFSKNIDLESSSIAYNTFLSPHRSCSILLRKTELRI